MMVRPAKAMSWGADRRCGSHVATGPRESTDSRPGVPPSEAFSVPPVQPAAASTATSAAVSRAGGLRRWSVRTGTGPRSGVARPGSGAGAQGLVELDLADAHGLRGHLDALVLAAELERLLQAQLARGHDLLEVVGGRRTHVGELLLLGDVDVHVVGAGVLTDDHALVDLGAGVGEEGAALLQVDHRVGRDDTGAVGHQGAAGAG